MKDSNRVKNVNANIKEAKYFKAKSLQKQFLVPEMF